MKLSRESQYGLTALRSLVGKPPEMFSSVTTIATETGLPSPFLAKTFAKLVRGGIVMSSRGKERGYRLQRPPEEISVKEIIEVIEGDQIFKRCVFWSNGCSEESPCPLHDEWRRLRPLVSEGFSQLSLASLPVGRLSAAILGKSDPKSTD